jgi:hypothetical protein
MTYSHHHPADRAKRRHMAAERKLIASFRTLYPQAKPDYSPNHSGERRATRAMLATMRHIHPERYPRQG